MHSDLLKLSLATSSQNRYRLTTKIRLTQPWVKRMEADHNHGRCDLIGLVWFYSV